MSDYDNSAALWKRQARDTDVAGKKYPHYQWQYYSWWKKNEFSCMAKHRKNQRGSTRY